MEYSIDDVKHEPKLFRLDLTPGKRTRKSYAILEYEELEAENGLPVYNLYHTEVPEQYRGRGIAKIVAQSAFKTLLANNCKLIVSCTYLQQYYLNNKDVYAKYNISLNNT